MPLGERSEGSYFLCCANMKLTDLRFGLILLDQSKYSLPFQIVLFAFVEFNRGDLYISLTKLM